MKSNLAKVSVALLSAVFILGCQDLGSGPVGPDGLVPQFGGPAHPGPHGGGDDVGEPDPGTLFRSAGDIAILNGEFPEFGGTYGGGATNTDDGPFGNVNFNQPRDDSHMHANVQVRDAPPGDYNIFGNQELVCNFEFPNHVDFDLRPGHATTVTVGANGKGKSKDRARFRGGAGPVA